METAGVQKDSGDLMYLSWVEGSLITIYVKAISYFKQSLSIKYLSRIIKICYAGLQEEWENGYNSKTILKSLDQMP